MDILKDKNYKSFNYTCRYSGVPYYYNTEDKKYIFGLGSNVKKDIPYVLHEIKDTDTLDYLALKYYNNPTYYWIIAYYNDIQDCFIHLSDYYKVIKIPAITSVQFGEER